MAHDRRSDTVESALARLFEAAPDAHWFSLPGGERLFSAGEAADAVYLLRVGRLGVFRREEGQDPHLLGVVKPGEPVGEMALIAGTPHTSTVVALRDSELIALPRDAFFAAARQMPELMTELARLMILRARQTGAHAAEPTVFGFLGCAEHPCRGFVEQVAAEVRSQGSRVQVIDSKALRSAAAWFSAVEESHDYVLYVAERGEVAWSHLVARQVDRLFLVGRAEDPAPHERLWAAAPLDEHRLVDLILIHRPDTVRPKGTCAWLDAKNPARWFHVRADDRGDAQRIARVLTGTSVGLVLSGGGARAYAHIGAIQALREAKVPIDFIGGSSMGGIVGGGVAMGWDQDELDDRIRKAFVDSSPVDDLTFPRIAMTRGRKVDRRLEEHYGEAQIEDLWRPFYCVSSNITAGGYVVHRTGSLRHALRASISLPGVLPPVLENGQVLVDGAVINNFPVGLMRAWHLGPVVGVDVSRARSVDPKALEPPKSWLRWIATGEWRRGPPIVSIMMRSATLSTRADLMEARSATDLLVIPEPAGVEIRDWKAYEPAVAAGYTATVHALAKLDGPVPTLRRRKHAAAAALVAPVSPDAPLDVAAAKPKGWFRRSGEKPAKPAPARRRQPSPAPSRS
ncbi:patatin-like phospholipase family protein [Caulobacter sp. 17J80-11]|uniref:patatin-like phospholipase family protein n=1 Tax=Caulobacter sp. 17J80-11 TaxID=2763502 RepID=UPI001653DB18|nr:patatin-like phospholipase family protein [Caulobacter sp. 17J80-11]MBC6981992.1 patatin-like phospholipase family protein [Caulobacter sp. 17J80-11]